jgi:hypothetical protein
MFVHFDLTLLNQLTELEMKLMSTLAAIMAIVCCATFVNAQEMAAKKPTAECQGECPITKAMGQLPKMTYKVGTESTCCSESAAALAKKSSEPIHYVVGKQTFETKDKAMASLVETTEAYVSTFITPCKCDVSGSTKIAGKACNCPVEAGKTAELVKAAASKVSMSYVVGEKSCNCPKEAAALAKNSKAKTEFVVAGEKTCCEMTARLNLAHAKYKAAVEALAANGKTENTETQKGS